MKKTTSTVAVNVPHLSQDDAGLWTVRVKEKRGEFFHLTKPTFSKLVAQRDLRSVRAAMVEMFIAKNRAA